MSDSAKRAIERLAAQADVRLNGTRPWDIQVHDERLYQRLLSHGSLGFGESYMDGWWGSERVDELFAKLLATDIKDSFKDLGLILLIIRNRLFNLESKAHAPKVAHEHYDLGNDLFEAMLDRRMAYSCGYWNPPAASGQAAKTLDEAQEAKLDLICRKIGLQKGQHVLDIGCGFGSFAGYAAETYGARVTGITISKQQAEKAREKTKGLPVEILLKDYRDLMGTFDHIVSVGMFEHVGGKNYRTYMEVAARCLKDDGLFLLHTIGGNAISYANDPWIAKYIFPVGKLPAIREIGKAIEGLFVMEDWHNFGADYDPTLMHWFKNFDAAWPKLKDKYGDRFYRMWKYYLLSCAGSFRARHADLWQIALSKKGVPGGYLSHR